MWGWRGRMRRRTRRCLRQVDAEKRPTGRSALDRDPAAVDLDGPPRDRQTEPAAAALTRTSVIDAEEPVEDPLAVLGRDAAAFVLHLEYGAVMMLAHTNQDTRMHRRVFDGVVEHIDDRFA